MESLAECGNTDAQWGIGQSYRFGGLVELDIALASYWLEKAASGGHKEAQHHLAWFYETGQYGYPIDNALSEEWYSRALDSGNPEMQYLYSLRYYGADPTSEDTIRLMQMAAAQGFEPAIEFLKALSN